MSAHEFSFTLELRSEPPTPELFEDLAGRVLVYAGCESEQAKMAVEGLQAAVEQAGAAHGPFRLEFSATRGSLSIALTCRDGRLWHTTQPTA